jgi:hypothetical protein
MKNSNNARKIITLGLISATLGLTLTGCGATGAESPTRNIRQVTDGVESTSGTIKALNVLLVAQADGSATLVGTLVNTGADSDAITSITANDVPAKIDPAQNELITDRPVIFSGDSATAKASFAGLNAAAGTRVNLTINFVTSASMKLSVLVRDKSEPYTNVG